MSKLLKALFGRFRGILNTLEEDRLGVRDLKRAINVDLDDVGDVTRRAGRTVQISGAAHSLWAPEDGSGPALFVQGGVLRKMTSLTTSLALGSGYSDLPMAYLKLNRRVYVTNTRETGVVDDDGLRAWGLGIPAVPSVTRTTGYLAAGTYLFTMTTLDDDGRESGADLAARVDLTDGSGLTFTWGDVDGTKVAIYITEPNGEMLYRAAVIDAAAGTFTWIGGVLAVSLDTQFLDKPPAGQALADHGGRIYIASGPVIYPTRALDHEHCDLRDLIMLDGTEVRFVAGVKAGIFAGTEQATYYLPGGRLEELDLNRIVAAPGIAGSVVISDAATIFGKGSGRVVLFGTGAGIYAGMDDGSHINLTRERYVFTAPSRAAALLRADQKLVQYLLNT